MKKILLINGLILLFLTSCRVYTVSPEKLKYQFDKSNNIDLKENRTENNKVIVRYNYDIIDSILVKDKKGKEKYLLNSPTILTRITEKSKKKHVFYFDTLIIDNDSLTGYRSLILKLKRKIPFKNITKIELQERVIKNQKRKIE